jgi:hypothetical protein
VGKRSFNFNHSLPPRFWQRIAKRKPGAEEPNGIRLRKKVIESRGKRDIKRAGIGATAGAIIGGIAGGGKGAGVGLIIGGAGGAGSLGVYGSKELKLENGTEMLVHVWRVGHRNQRRHRLRRRKAPSNERPAVNR